MKNKKQVTNKRKIRTRFTYIPNSPEAFEKKSELPSMTIPDQSYGVLETIRRYQSGLSQENPFHIEEGQDMTHDDIAVNDLNMDRADLAKFGMQLDLEAQIAQEESNSIKGEATPDLSDETLQKGGADSKKVEEQNQEETTLNN